MLENITTIIYMTCSIVSFLIALIVLFKQHKNAKSREEDEQIDQQILETLMQNLTRLKNYYKSQNLNLTNKQLIQLTKKALKEEKVDEKTQNQQQN